MKSIFSFTIIALSLNAMSSTNKDLANILNSTLLDSIATRSKCHKKRKDLVNHTIANQLPYVTEFQEYQTDLDLTPLWNCLFLKRGLGRDSQKCHIPPERTLSEEVLATLKDGESRLIKGNIKYLGVYPGGYRYDLINRSGKLEAEVRVHFKNKMGDQDHFENALKAFENAFLRAEKLWESNIPMSLKDQLRFNFKVERDHKKAHFSVKLLDTFSRGPYNQNWSTSMLKENGRIGWIAHELAHMMGLDDEYDNFKTSTIAEIILKRNKRKFGRKYDSKTVRAITKNQVSQCGTYSIMCNSRKGEIQARHYYVILKRAFCSGN